MSSEAENSPLLCDSSRLIFTHFSASPYAEPGIV